MPKLKVKPIYKIFYDKKHGTYHLIKITPKLKQLTSQ
jgi:hypothetical protein